MTTAAILLGLGCSVLSAQSTSGSIQGTVTDEQNKPVAGALVTITRTFATAKAVVAPYSQSVKTAGDGSFLAPGLAAGTYSYCAQVAGDGYLNGCRSGQVSADLTVAAGQKVVTTIRLAKGSILKIRVLDPGNLASAASNTKKLPSILMGVWDSHGRYLPAHNTGKDSAGLDYQVTIPLDAPMSFQILSSKLKLSDSGGLPVTAAATAASASQTAFQHNTGDANPKSFLFTITGVNP